MALSARRTVFGVHSVTPYSRTDKTPYGIALVVQNGTFSLEGDTIELRGGSNRFSWEIEDGDINAELGFSVSEYPSWLFTLFAGKTPTDGSAETSGNVTSVANFKGTSVVAATGILATVTVSTAADLKMGRYVLKARDADTLDLYCLSNIDFSRGTDVDFTNESLLVASFDPTTGGTHAISGFGITFTGGAGTIAFTTGDTAYFDVRPVNTVNRLVKIGGISDEFPEFGAMIYAQKKGSGAVFEIEAYKLKSIGMSLGAERKAWANQEYVAKAAYDPVENAIARIREVE
jgi:hypothetical protein